MIIYYPTYYLVPVFPMSLDDDDYNADYNSRCNIECNEIYNSYRTTNENIFYEADEEYVNDNIK